MRCVAIDWFSLIRALSAACSSSSSSTSMTGGVVVLAMVLLGVSCFCLNACLAGVVSNDRDLLNPDDQKGLGMGLIALDACGLGLNVGQQRIDIHKPHAPGRILVAAN